MTRSLVVSFVTLFLSTCGAQDDVQEKFQRLVQTLSLHYNVSISLAIKLDSGEEFAAAHGHTQKVTTSSLIPCGSAAKPFTAVGILRLADAGLLGLDTPISSIIDPWHARQSIPSLREIFKDARISSVTSRQLIAMKSGIVDYNNSGMFDWTLQHPSLDYLPMHYISDAGKQPFMFDPDTSASYTSNGYVLAGMVLAAVQNVSTWRDMDQMAAVGPIDGEPLKNTLFMKDGRCSQHAGVTHQYTVRDRRPQGNNGATCAARSGEIPYGRLQGVPLQAFRASSYEECCEEASKDEQAQAFIYENDTCSKLLYARSFEPSANATSGFTVRYFKESEVVDLYDYSCLNGWTMGNIAFAAIDSVKFWHALLASKSLLKPQSLAIMLNFSQLKGWGQGMEYGSGLMKTSLGAKVKGYNSCKPPLCICKSGQCMLNATQFGHLGADWGSSMPLNGYISQIGVAVAVSLTSVFSGMNSSLSEHENSGIFGFLECEFLQIVYQYKFPGFPDLDCAPQGTVHDGAELPFIV